MLPKAASLSEMTIWSGETEMNGEVVTKAEADKIYNEEKQKGNDAGKAEKKSYQTFDFYIAKIPAQGEPRVSFVYYQPLENGDTVSVRKASLPDEEQIKIYDTLGINWRNAYKTKKSQMNA